MESIDKITEYLKLFISPDQWTELRAFGKAGIFSGFFDFAHLDQMAKAAVEIERTGAKGIYFVPNPVDIEAINPVKRNVVTTASGGKCTTDSHILRRSWLLIDIDPVRKADDNASEDERAAAWRVTTQVQSSLQAVGFASPIVASSGNGWHLSYRVDMPNDEKARDSIKILLSQLSSRYDTEQAKVDIRTFNASRIWKLYGTAARKGEHTAERPHRVAFVASGGYSDSPKILAKKNTSSISKLLESWKRQDEYLRLIDSQRERPELYKRAENYLSRIPGAVSGENGHGQTYHAAMILVEGFGLGREEAIHLMMEWNNKCSPPWTQREIEHKVDSAIRSISNKGYLAGAAPSAQAMVRTTGKLSYTGPDQVTEKPLGEDDGDATADDLIKLQATIQWMWPGWIQRGTLTCLASDPGCGKTRLCADLTKRLWHGMPWPDGQTNEMPKESKVMWVAADNQWAELGTIPGEFGFPPEAIVLNSRRSNPYAGTNLDAIEDLAEFERRIRRVAPAIVFVDTCGNATDRNQGRAEEAKAFFKPLAEIATRTNTSIVLVTHLNRGGQVLGNRIMGAVRQVIKLEHPDKGQQNRRLLAVEKTNSVKPDDLGVTMGTEGNEYDNEPPSASGEERKAGRPSHLNQDKAWLQSTLAHGMLRVSIVRSKAGDHGIGASRLYNAKDSLGVIEEEIDGRLFWKLPDSDEVDEEEDE